MQRSPRANSEERLTVVAALLILGLAAAWCVVAWQYLARQRAELLRARSGAITLVQAVTQDFIGVSHRRGGLQLLVNELFSEDLQIPGDLQGTAERNLSAMSRAIDACRCGAPRPRQVIVLAVGEPESSWGIAPAGESPARDDLILLRASVLASDQRDKAAHFLVVDLNDGPAVAHIRYLRAGATLRGAIIAFVPVSSLIEHVFRPAVDENLLRLLPLHQGRDSVVRFHVRSTAGGSLYRSFVADEPATPNDGPSFSWSDSTAGTIPRPNQPASFTTTRGGSAVLLERPFWTSNVPALIVSVSVDVPALLYGIPGSPPPVPAVAVWMSMLAVALLGGGGLFALHRARRLMRARTLFFSGISHELRTPLTQVLLYGESLQEGALSPEQRDRAQHVIVRETRRLVHMIENVLLLARGGARHIPLNLGAADVGEVVADTLQSLQLLLDRHRTNLILTRAPVTAWIDVGATRQIVVNLVDNALRYGPTGQTLRITVHPHDTGVLLTVHDEGPGIPREDRHRVFLPFEKGRTDEGSSGTGLGLALVRQLADAMRGWVRIDDTPLPGLSISVWFPPAGGGPHKRGARPA